MLTIGPRVVLKIGPRYSLFPNVYSSVLGVCFKTQIVSIGAEHRVFAKLSGCQK